MSSTKKSSAKQFGGGGSASKKRVSESLLRGIYDRNSVCDHPDVFIRRCIQSVSETKAWDQVKGSDGEKARQRANLVKIYARERFSAEVEEWFTTETFEVQTLPIVQFEGYEGPTLLDAFKTFFQIDSLDDHNQDIIRRMMSDTRTVDSLYQRLLKVNSIFLQSSPEGIRLRDLTEALFAPYKDGHPGVLLVKGCLNSTSDWPEFYTLAMRTLQREGLVSSSSGSKIPATKEADERSGGPSHGSKGMHSGGGGADGRSPRFVPRFKPRRFEKHHKKVSSIVNSLRRKSQQSEEYDDGHSSGGSSCGERHGEEEYDVRHHEEGAYSSDDGMQEVEEHADQFKDFHDLFKEQAAAHEAERAQMESRIHATSSKLNALQIQHNKLQKSFRHLQTNRSAGGDSTAGRKQGAHGGGGNSRSPAKHKKSSNAAHRRRVANAVFQDRYTHNPKGTEAWKRWFQVCARCRQWGLHFAKDCRNDQHPENRRNTGAGGENNNAGGGSYRNPVPMNQYPKDITRAMALARQELEVYGAVSRFNCKREDIPEALQKHQREAQASSGGGS